MREGALTQSMRLLANLLENRTGQVLSENRLWRLETSLRPIVRAHGMTTLDELVASVMSNLNGPLADAAVNALLNNETSFFRDPHIFRMLAQELLPAFVADAEERGAERVVKVWCAGCSTGQEAFSLAMMFQNNRANWPGWRMQILATDVSGAVIEKAKSGVISQMDAQRGLAINDLLKWMAPVGEDWKMDGALRGMIDFRADNLFSPAAPMGEYDLIFCRNVMLYFAADRKKMLFETLARHSAPGGHLLLGAGETVMGLTTDFVTCPRYRGTYQRTKSPLAADGL
ncbi:MAG: protein-glutamate O-methyltransferase CheR [Sphingobium sp.]